MPSAAPDLFASRLSSTTHRCSRSPLPSLSLPSRDPAPDRDWGRSRTGPHTHVPDQPVIKLIPSDAITRSTNGFTPNRSTGGSPRACWVYVEGALTSGPSCRRSPPKGSEGSRTAWVGGPVEPRRARRPTNRRSPSGRQSPTRSSGVTDDLRPGVLFDVDGTLCDTNYLHALAWSRALRDAGERAPTNAIHRLVGMGGDQLLPELDRSGQLLSSHPATHSVPRTR